MPSGGARIRSGPAPDPQALRRERPGDAATWRHLPAAGRQGPAPAWPLPTVPSKAEKKLWEELWRMPQAIVWEEQRQAMAVAAYVLAYANFAVAIPAERLVAVRLMGELGISIPGLRSNRWVIDPPVAEEEAAAPPERPAGRAPARDRLRLVSTG